MRGTEEDQRRKAEVGLEKRRRTPENKRRRAADSPVWVPSPSCARDSWFLYGGFRSRRAKSEYSESY
ncbi:hypothetical protein [Methanoculleus sp.]|uniref:hypothetical protein n=1 Tax=Methanoculleus sp. TaxID=90427 RepID=UPI0025F782B7|nr:hypothetical protein [Methanoculleus sp.]